MANPVLEMITAFKSIHVLNDVLKKKDERGRPTLKPSHYCCVLINGPSPVWGIWTATGKFVRFSGSKSEIEEAYPEKAWTRVMASWMLQDADKNMTDVSKRVHALEETYGGHIEREAPAEPKPRPRAAAGSRQRSNVPHHA